MIGALLEKIGGLFGKKEEEPLPPPEARRDRDPDKPLVKQVFEGRPTETPDFAQGVEDSRLIEVCMENVVCRFTPHMEYKKIFTTRKGIDGNLETEYEGLAADCGAVKNFGLRVAQQDGYVQAYRYVDLNHILRCCCGNPKKCLFHQCAVGEDEDLGKAMRRVGS